jgi:hypothetical protein
MMLRNRLNIFALIFVLGVAFGDTFSFPESNIVPNEQTTTSDSLRTNPHERPASPMSPLGLTIGNVGEDLYIESDAVGIGISMPAYKLDVNGTGRFSGQVTIPLTPTVDAHAASKKYVDDRVSGSGDNWGTQTVESDASLIGNGTSSNKLRVANGSVVSQSTTFRLYRLTNGW